jgi:hypothetical protein
MTEIDPIRQALTHYRKKRQQLIDEIKPKLDEISGLDSIIVRLASDAGESANIQPLSVASALGAEDGLSAGPPVRSGGGALSLRPDEFFGMTQTEAARKYLKMAGGRAIPLDDLVAALQKGGAKLGGADPKRTLYVSLKVNPNKEFVWPTKDHVGLAEAYKKK